MAQTPPFEIPQQLRELAERNVEQARTAYGQFMDAMVQATGMWMGAMFECVRPLPTFVFITRSRCFPS